MIKDNKGVVSIEAALILPVFIFCMLALYSIGRAKMAELVVYEACNEMAEYLSEYGYIDDGGILIDDKRLAGYIDDEKLVEQYISGGIKGIDIGESYKSEDGNIVLVINYEVGINLPFVPELKTKRSISIKQKIYKGYDDLYEEDDSEYVYITPNKEAYHSSRSCSYLAIKTYLVDINIAKEKGYSECKFCEGECGAMVYISEDGSGYHSSRQCQGLKRTVYRVKKGEVEGTPSCHRCGN